jgi:hypothetical protein
MITVYPCSKARHYLWWQGLRAAGLPIATPCWIDAEFNATGEDLDHAGWASHWSECISLAASCELTLFLALPGEQHAGAVCEVGAALSAGRQVFAVSAVDFHFSPASTLQNIFGSSIGGRRDLGHGQGRAHA